MSTAPAASVSRRLLIAAVVLAAVVGAVAGAVVAAITGGQGTSGGNQPVITQSNGGGVAVAALAARLRPSVVLVLTQPVTAASLAQSQGGLGGVADGVVVSSNGYILTSADAVRGATQLRVADSSGHIYNAYVVGSDTLHGEVLLRAAGASGMTPVSLAAAQPQPGDTAVLVADTPLSSTDVGVGTVRGDFVGSDPSGGVLAGATIADIAADPAYQGAPVVTADGTLVGVTLLVSGGSSSSVVISSPAAAAALLQAAQANAAPLSFGIAYAPIGHNMAAAVGAQPGALVLSVVPQGPAAAAGIKPGDIVTQVNGSPVTSQTPLEPATFSVLSGATVTFTIWRAGHVRTVEVALHSS